MATNWRYSVVTVYIVQEPRPFRNGETKVLQYPDLSPATTYGAPLFVFSANDQPGLTPGPSFAQARKVLKDFSDEHYLLWAGGDPVALSIATMVAASINFGRIRFLRWEKNSRRMEGEGGAGGFYIPVDLKLNP
jgi:hypothetical protein